VTVSDLVSKKGIKAACAMIVAKATLNNRRNIAPPSPRINSAAVLQCCTVSPQESPGATLFNPPFGVMFGRGLSLLSFLGVFTGLENKKQDGANLQKIEENRRIALELRIGNAKETLLKKQWRVGKTFEQGQYSRWCAIAIEHSLIGRSSACPGRRKGA
jgi:hypothetical protein